jgi:glycosyltransferase involved in cell wall biosynthesis
VKLLFVIDNLSTGGAQRQMVTLAIGLAQRGYPVELFCYAPGDMLARPLYDVGIPVHWYFKRSRYSPDVIFALRNQVYRGDYDLMLSFMPTPNFYAILVGRILSLHRVPVIVSERRIDLPQGPSLLERFSRQSYRLATRVVTNSHHQRITMAGKYPWLRGRLSTIYNGHDLLSFSPAAAEPDNHPIRVLAIANVAPQKNGLCLVEALNILHKRDGLSPRVDWIGRHPRQGDPLEYLDQMKHRIKAYGLERQWQWLDLRTDIVDQLRQHDVLVHPAYIEGLPNVVSEALACGRPVIVSDTLDHSRLVRDGENGYSFDYQNPADLADKIKMFIDLPVSERRKMGECSRQFAEANLSQERLVDDYERLFLSVVEN